MVVSSTMTHTHKDGLSDLLALANTSHGPGAHYRVRAREGDPDHDHLDDPADARRYLADHAVDVPAANPSAAEIADLRRVRAATRGVIDGGPGPADPEVSLLIERARYRLAADGRIRSAHAGWRGVVDAMLPGLVELDRSRDRLRVCANPLCRFVFVDRSRNANRRWCEMAVCGNRVKGRRFRHRMDAVA
ncbi:MAG TPA: CGNR zinc finger domain-containing protein [Candidatus Limnocylindrales bacterium]